MLGGGDELGGGRWGGGAEVGDEVGDGEVGLVADGGDDGQMRGGDGAGEGLVVEGGEVFDGASAAGDEDEVGAFEVLVEPADAGNDAARTGRSLHDGGVDEEVEAGVAAADDGDDVADDGPGGGGDDADAVRERREGAFAVGVEEAFICKAALELLEGKLQGTRSARLQGFSDELELASTFVDGDAAADEDGEAVHRFEAEELGLAAEEDDGKLGFAVLEGEVDVAGGGGAAVGDLTFYPDIRVRGFGPVADVGDERANGPDMALRRLWDGSFVENGRLAGSPRRRRGLFGFGWSEEAGLGGALGAGFAAQRGQSVRGGIRVISRGHPE